MSNEYDSKLFVLLSDNVTVTIKNYTVLTQKEEFKAVDIGIGISSMTDSLEHQYTVLTEKGYAAFNPNDNDFYIDNNIGTSDCYLLNMRRKLPNTPLVNIISFYVFFKYIEVPESFKETFDKYYTKYSLMKINPYTESNMYNLLVDKCYKLSGIKI